MQSFIPKYFRDDERISFNANRLNYSNSSSKEEHAIRVWRSNCYTKNLKVRKTSILYKVYKRTEFTNRELAIAESFAQWLGTHVGECFVKAKQGKKDYGSPSIPQNKYLILTDLTSQDHDFLDQLVEYFYTNKVNNFLKRIW